MFAADSVLFPLPDSGGVLEGEGGDGDGSGEGDGVALPVGVDVAPQVGAGHMHCPDDISPGVFPDEGPLPGS